LHRPPFIWSLYYTTENGHYYNQQWQDATDWDYSKIRLYLYDRVSSTSPGHPFIAGTPYSGGNPRISGWGNVSHPSIQTNALPGELITGVVIECTGYNCGLFGENDSDHITVRYKGCRPQNFSISGAPTQLCRNQSYTLNWNASLGASSYVVQSSVGTITYTGGTTAQLYLPDTTPGSITSATITVGAQAGCGAILPTSSISTIVIPVAPGPEPPQNMQLSNGRCPTTSSTDKTVSVTGPLNAQHRWTIINNGAGAYFPINGSTTYTSPLNPTGNASVAVKTPNIGSLTISAEVLTNCGGYSAPISQTYQITTPTPVCPTGITFPATWCTDNPNQIILQGARSDLTYTLNTYSIVPNDASVTFTPTNTPGTINATLLPSPRSGTYPRSFGVLVTVTSPCPASGSGVVTCTSAPLFPNSVSTNASACGTPGGGMKAQLAVPATLYPNPASGQIEIVPSGAIRYDAVKVLDIQGRIVVEKQATQQSELKAFDVKALPAGLYQVQLFNGGRMEAQRLVKE
jgi:hypothetical protein